jgi:hypothetical protein
MRHNGFGLGEVAFVRCLVCRKAILPNPCYKPFLLVFTKNSKMKYQDLMYFGYEWDADSKKNETDFIKEIKDKFPNVELKDAFDSIKGYRQEVYLEETENDNYWAWLIAFGWLELSLTGQLMLMDKDQKEKLHKYINLAKSQYPQNFKSEAVS